MTPLVILYCRDCKGWRLHDDICCPTDPCHLATVHGQTDDCSVFIEAAVMEWGLELQRKERHVASPSSYHYPDPFGRAQDPAAE